MEELTFSSGTYFIIAIMALATSMVVIALMVRVAPAVGMIDVPDSRKVHSVPAQTYCWSIFGQNHGEIQPRGGFSQPVTTSGYQSLFNTFILSNTSLLFITTVLSTT